MIQDTLENSARYEVLCPRFAKAFAFLRTVDGTQTLGRHEIDGDQVFALVERYHTKPLENGLFEAHRKYIDVQFLYSGRETILWTPLALMQEETRSYDAVKDIAKWKLVPDYTPLHLSAGHMVILYPQDAHAPTLEWGQSEQVFKVVVKVAVE
jgi:biofilm protein TabA